MSTFNSLAGSTNFTKEELQRLMARFIKLDKDSSGTIEKEEFLAIPAIQSNPLAQRLMEVFDVDGDGHVDFGEFITGLSVFSSRGNREEKLKFAFNVYDIDGDGKLSNGELFIVLKAMVGNNLQEAQLQQIVDKTILEADEDGDGCLSFAEFMKVIDSSALAASLTLDSF
ncbi:Calcineurin subunit B [Wickerhamiella sorbophila]|uniref:Calcineurin subunit B n=1 Tax=Wickerhamiella sorbophila TaxID=45607 RepID=A0A2T0FD91_9ASCO|nr:Calcineurin subunit B [Wickerhamiella sorbophila]PRT52966.1 Calcineurin subunit B [Wickerhamiella sorbophila]